MSIAFVPRTFEQEGFSLPDFPLHQTLWQSVREAAEFLVGERRVLDRMGAGEASRVL
jgi:hypothetical protein